MTERKAVVVMGEDDEEDDVVLQSSLSTASTAITAATPVIAIEAASFLAETTTNESDSAPSTTVTPATQALTTEPSNDNDAPATTATAATSSRTQQQTKIVARSALERHLHEKNTQLRQVTSERTIAFYALANKDLSKVHAQLGKSLAQVQEVLNVSTGVTSQLNALNEKLNSIEPLM